MENQKKPRESINPNQTLNSQSGCLRDLLESDWWKLVSAELNNMIIKIKEHLRTPWTDQSIKYNADHLLKERLSLLNILINIPELQLETVETMIAGNLENEKPLFDRIQQHNQKLANEILSSVVKI